MVFGRDLVSQILVLTFSSTSCLYGRAGPDSC